MKPALLKCVIVLGCLMAVSHQAMYQPHSQWLQFPHPYFLGVPSSYQQMQRAAYLKGFYDAGRLGVSPAIYQQQHKGSEIVAAGHQANDAHARFRSPLDVQDTSVTNETGVDELGRLFFSGATINDGASANYFLKTSFVFTTSSITLCFLSSCIPPAQFSPGSSNVICRRKRNAFIDDDDGIVPSHVEKVEPTPFMVLDDPNFKPVPEGREITVNTVPLIDSSIMSPTGDDDGTAASTSPAREKRFLYLLTSTITSFKVISSTYTTTLTLTVANALLTCRPSGLTIC